MTQPSEVLAIGTDLTGGFVSYGNKITALQTYHTNPHKIFDYNGDFNFLLHLSYVPKRNIYLNQRLMLFRCHLRRKLPNQVERTKKEGGKKDKVTKIVHSATILCNFLIFENQ